MAIEVLESRELLSIQAISGSPVTGRSSVTPDGRFAVLISGAANVFAGQVDQNAGSDVFLFDRSAGTPR